MEAAALQGRAQALQASKLEARAAGASVEAQDLLGLWDSSPWGLLDTGEGGQGVTPSPAVAAPVVWAAVKVHYKPSCTSSCILSRLSNLRLSCRFAQFA